MGELVRSDVGTRQRRGGEPDHSHQLLRLRSRGVQLWRSGGHSQHRPGTVSAFATVLLLHPSGVLTMRTRHFAIAAGLLALAACNFDITNDNQPTLDDLVKNPPALGFQRPRPACSRAPAVASRRSSGASAPWVAR